MKANAWIKFGCLLIVAAAALLPTSTHADTPVFMSGWVSSNRPSSFTGTKGWNFYPQKTITITQLGVFDDGGDGLVNSHQIGLWRGDGTLLASATVPAGTDAPLVDGYRYVSITPVVLDSFVSSIVAAQYSSGDADDQVTPVRGQLNGDVFVPFGALGTGGRDGLGSNLPYPNNAILFLFGLLPKPRHT